MAFDPGDLWTPELTVKDPDGVLTAATVTLAVTDPAGTVTNPAVSTVSTGVYTASVLLTSEGRWLATWTVSGAVTGVETQSAYVRALGSNVISVSDVRARLNKILTVDDAEIDDMITAALAEYADKVGPLPGTRTEYLDGGGNTLILSSPNATAITSAAYDSGSTITTTDLTVRDGIVRWGYGTAGRFTYGAGNVVITYTVGSLPANHREAIIADVAGYFAATQRGPAGLPGEGYEAAFTSSPMTLFPRIRALAAPGIA